MISRAESIFAVDAIRQGNRIVTAKQIGEFIFEFVSEIGRVLKAEVVSNSTRCSLAPNFHDAFRKRLHSADARTDQGGIPA